MKSVVDGRYQRSVWWVVSTNEICEGWYLSVKCMMFGVCQ